MDAYLELVAKHSRGPLPEIYEPSLEEQLKHTMKPIFDEIAFKHGIDLDMIDDEMFF